MNINMISSLMNMLNANNRLSSNVGSSKDANTHSEPQYNNSNNTHSPNDCNGYGKSSVANNIGVNVFAAQNGLGERIDISKFGNSVENDNASDSNKNNTQNNSQSYNNEQAQPDISKILSSMQDQNPMLAMLQLMQGQNGAGNNMTAMLPMLMSFMQKPNATTKSAQNDTKDKTDNKDSDNFNTNKRNGNAKDSRNAPHTDIGQNNEHKKDDSQNNSFERTQYNQKQTQRDRDFFSPIAFAGYSLISALNKLYFTTARRLHKADIYRKEL